MSSSTFLTLIAARRSNYALRASSPIPDARIVEIVQDCILHVPSAFNSQSSRVVILFKHEHEKLWDIAKSVLKGIVPAERFPSTEQRLNGFRAGYGTVLFFVSKSRVQDFASKIPSYADRFPTWATQSDGMHQFAVWTALEAEGLGCNIQHYNPLIDEKVAEEWGIEKDWELSAQVVFGEKAGGPGNKSFEAVEGRVRVFGA